MENIRILPLPVDIQEKLGHLGYTKFIIYPDLESISFMKATDDLKTLIKEELIRFGRPDLIDKYLKFFNI